MRYDRVVTLEEQKDPAITQDGPVGNVEEWSKRPPEVILGQASIEIVTPAQPLLKHRVQWRNPLQRQPAAGQAGAEIADVRKGRLLPQNQVMNHRQHQHQVELPCETFQERKMLSISPSRRRGGPGDVRHKRRYCMALPRHGSAT